MRFTIDDILTATDGRLVGRPPSNGPFVIDTDSRQILPGSIFWALRGRSFDGHDFVETAADRGAALSVVSQGSLKLGSPDRGHAIIEVQDTLKALADLARWHRRRFSIPVIGITGSVGKTTTREMLSTILSARQNVLQSPRNFNNHLGVPLTLLQLNASHDAAVIEMGASSTTEISSLCGVAEPTIGIVTAIGRAHVGGFGSIEATAAAKGELIESLPADGLAVLPGDDPWFPALAERARCRIVRTGTGDDNDVTGRDVRLVEGCLQLLCDTSANRTGRVTLPVPALHLTGAVLMSLAVAREFDIAIDSAAEALKSFQSPAGRCRIVRTESLTVIDDAYNASPESVLAAIRMLAGFPGKGRRILVLGDMLELGSDSESAHEEVGIAAAESRLDAVFAVGQFAETFSSAARAAGYSDEAACGFATLEELSPRLVSQLQAGDVVLVKGSRGMRMERLVEPLEQWHKQFAGPTEGQAGDSTLTTATSTTALHPEGPKRHAGLVD